MQESFCTTKFCVSELFPRVDAGYNTCTMALRVVEGTKREPGAWGTTGPPCHWGT
jgi:hypothetical protein